MVGPKVCQVPCSIPAAHKVDVSSLGIDTHLVTSSMSGTLLHVDGLVRMVVMMNSLMSSIGAKSLPDRFVVIRADVLIKKTTFGCFHHEFLCALEIASEDQLLVQFCEQRVLQLNMSSLL